MVWHLRLTDAQTERLDVLEKRAILLCEILELAAKYGLSGVQSNLSAMKDCV